MTIDEEFELELEPDDSIPFEVVSEYKPEGDQPKAIEQLVKGIRNDLPAQTLLGATGTGKTFTIANVIQTVNKPTLVMAPNKTLAAQLYREFKEFFPNNAVEYFVSYYDYYQPEAYIPSSDTFIEKDASINDELDKLRLSATKSLLERRDTIVVASVSCIYGIGSPSEFHNMCILLREGDEVPRDELMKKLVGLQYNRRDQDFHRGTFRVRGDTVDIYPAFEDRKALRVEFFGDEIEAIYELDPMTGKKLSGLKRAVIFPTTVYATTRDTLKRAINDIEEELADRLRELEDQGKLIEYARLKQRTEYDLELMREMGVCPGIENYSRHLSGRAPGESPFTLMDYFPDDFLLVIDESHLGIPQIGGMYQGDRNRKETLVGFGFRLPSALDNRPLKFNEFEKRINQAIFVSATPAEYELEKSGGVVVEQIIRPTGLVDPQIVIRPVEGQVQDVISEVHKRKEKDQRVLVTTLTKRFSEELTEYLVESGLKVRYMHSDVKVLERVEIIQELRAGEIDVLVGINLLREGLDLPEVSLVAILDADKEGFLRSSVSLIQTVGRAARNAEGVVIMYADRVTDSMQKCIDETNRRREKQEAFNKEHNITPRTIRKNVSKIIETSYKGNDGKDEELLLVAEDAVEFQSPQKLRKQIVEIRKQMKKAAADLDFELAAALRDQMLKAEKALEKL